MTAIHYPDLTTTSPAGRVRLEIRSPDNDSVNPRPISEASERRLWGGFQYDFVITARATKSGDVIWQRKQLPEEPSPRAAWVDDDGRAVVQTVGPLSSQLVLLDATGRVARRIDLGDHLSEHEFGWTSAGPTWEHGGHGYMIRLTGGRPHWCFRLLNGRRLLIDLNTCALADAAEHADALGRAEWLWAFNTLQRVVPLLDEWEREEDPWSHALAAMDELLVATHLAGVLGVRAAAPLVQRVERCALETGYTTGRLPEAATPETPDGQIEVAFLAFRQLAGPPCAAWASTRSATRITCSACHARTPRASRTPRHRRSRFPSASRTAPPARRS